MDLKRLILATLLSAIVVLVYEWWVARSMPPRPRPTAQPAASPQPTAQPSPAADSRAPASGPAGGPTGQTTLSAPAGETVRVDAGTFEAFFSTAGARLTEVRLRDYRTAPGPGAPRVVLGEAAAGALAPLVAAPAQAPGGTPAAVPPAALYAVEPAGGLALGPGQEGTLTFSAATPDGLRVTVRYVFRGGSYAFRLEQTVASAAAGPLAVQPVLRLRQGRDLADEHASGVPAGAVALTPGGVRRIEFGDAREPVRVPGPVEWAGWYQKYFAGLALPKGPAVAAVVVEGEPAAAPAGQAAPAAAGPAGQVQLVYPAAVLAPGGSASVAVQVYMGPKDVGALRAVNPSLERVIDLGFFQWLAMPLLLLLRWLHGLLGNYGLAIIALTVIVKIVLWPLTARQIRAAKGMQKLQPLILQLREKYKDDREAMSRELMQLYRRHNVNPLMGCLPILIQIPVFIALYRVLNDAIELRHAPFFGWIHDLSARDPYYVTPILMGVSAFVAQKMMPPAGDPTQQKILLAMPLLFTFLFLGLPSGLVLYWLVQNLLQIAQQLYTERVAR